MDVAGGDGDFSSDDGTRNDFCKMAAAVGGVVAVVVGVVVIETISFGDFSHGDSG